MQPSFSDPAIRFLSQLEKHNNREWFAKHREVYERELRSPLLDLIGAVNQHMLQFAPAYARDPAKCAMRIYRDIRFSKDKRPYKTHLSAWWGGAGLEKTSGGGFYFEMSATRLMVAAGVYMPEKEQLLAIRRMLLEQHEVYRDLLSARTLRSLGMAPIDGLKMVRGPKGFTADGPAADLILQRQWGVSGVLPIETALSSTLVKKIATRFKAAAPLVMLLNGPLHASARNPALFGALTP